MKKFIIILCSILLVGCSTLSNSPKKQVEIFLNKYQTLDEQVLNDIDYTIYFDTDLTNEQKDDYKDIMKRQYRDLTYTIKDEKIDGDLAVVEVEIEVYDYKKPLNLDNYISDNIIDTLKEKLSNLTNASDRVKYTLNLTLTKNNNTWVVDDLSDEQLMKINGVY